MIVFRSALLVLLFPSSTFRFPLGYMIDSSGIKGQTETVCIFLNLQIMVH